MPGAVNVAIRWVRAGGGASSIAASIGNAVAAGLTTSVTPIATGIGNAVAAGLTASVNNSGGPTVLTAPVISVWRSA